MAIRQQYYLVYEGADIDKSALAFEILGFEDHFRTPPFPLIYLSPNLDEAARILEEIVLFREVELKIGGMERTSEFYFQVQRTRLVNLDPLDSERKWGVFRRVVEGYNLGDVGCCSFLGDFLDQNLPRLIEGAYAGRGTQTMGGFSLPGDEKSIADLINAYNRAAIARSGGS